MSKTLSIKGRSPRRTPTRQDSEHRSLGNLSDALEAVLANEIEAKPEIPVVRLKSTDATYNARGDRVILIRRTPFAKNSEYEPAEKRVSYKALLQWTNAGIGALFPQEHREAAEMDLLDTVHRDMRFKYKDARNAYLKHKDAVAKLTEEIEPDVGSEHIDFRRTNWVVRQSEFELNKSSAIEGMDRYQSLLQGIAQGCVITNKGARMVTQAMLLAMCDALPSAELTDLPDGARHDLREAVKDKALVSADLVAKFLKLESGPWTSEGTRTTIRQCASQLLELEKCADTD